MPETFRVEITPSAEADIGGIWDYLAQDAPEQASAFISALETQIVSLQQFPERCPHIAENAILGTNYRHLLHGPYRTIFRISCQSVVILRVIHGARLLNDEFLSS
ncbi:MAG: type II toxin-antitoxin system RelE/ParE family toxin [Desulfuromusa sp.]|nr:type II toxin-antitoxin system RelE/ParE family toxin [Desulfuromusa sp.]